MVSKVIIVTGANRGIGLAVSDYLLNHSHKLVLVSRSTDQLEVLKEQFPSQVEYLAADMTIPNVCNVTTRMRTLIGLTIFRLRQEQQNLRSSHSGSSTESSSITVYFRP